MEKDLTNAKRYFSVEPTICTVHLENTETPITDEHGVQKVDDDGNQLWVKREIQPTFKGRVTLRRPSFDERAEMLESMGLGESTSNDEIDKFSVKNGMPVVRRMIKQSVPFYEKVEIERLDDGEKFESFDDLTFEPECASILIEVATALMRGQRIGKNSKP